ncbi:hypothetical protein ACIQKB_36850 [Streptomyces sp. NPDC092046]|uniref:hypothetical protein n=1 Tax=Streptomyces sp. NPDC092046 TaxID=3366009 RepID=UPI00382AE448
MARRPFPADLIRTQQAWTATYTALADAGTGSTTVLRRRLLRLSAALWWHPWWAASGDGPAARVELRELVRTGCEEEVRAA